MRGASPCRSASESRSRTLLEELVQPRGVAVRLEATHLCTQMRGVAEEGSRTRTTFWRGLYDERAELRAEFLAEVGNRR